MQYILWQKRFPIENLSSDVRDESGDGKADNVAASDNTHHQICLTDNACIDTPKNSNMASGAK